MAKMVGQGDWASALSKAFGFDPKNVRSLILEVAVDAVVMVTAEIYVDDSQTDVIETIKKVVWVEDPQKEEDNGTTE